MLGIAVLVLLIRKMYIYKLLKNRTVLLVNIFNSIILVYNSLKARVVFPEWGSTIIRNLLAMYIILLSSQYMNLHISD